MTSVLASCGAPQPEVEPEPRHKMYGGLAISTDPPEAHVWVNGSYQGQTRSGEPLYSFRQTNEEYTGSVFHCSDTITVKKRGYKDYTTSCSYKVMYPDPGFETSVVDTNRPFPGKPGRFHFKPNLDAPWKPIMIVLEPGQ